MTMHPVAALFVGFISGIFVTLVIVAVTTKEIDQNE